MKQSEFISTLSSLGCDTDKALERMLNDVEFYYECILSFFEDTDIDIVKSAIDSGDSQAAFDAVHTIKGVAGNLGLTPLYDCSCALVEPLRNGQIDSIGNLYKDFLDVYNIFKSELTQ